MRGLDEIGFLLHITKLHVTSLYHAYRKVCAPPMLKIGIIPEGTIWYHSLGGIVACLGNRSLVVAYAGGYAGGRSRDAEISKLRAAHCWLMGSCEKAPDPYVRFVAHEDPKGQLTVRRLLMGDWAGFPYRGTLPPSRELSEVGFQIMTGARRNYATFWEWPTKQTKEAGIMSDFLNARDVLQLEPFETVVSGANPPDFVGVRGDSTTAVELTELVSEEAVVENIAAAQPEDRAYKDWTPKTAIAAIQERIDDKDGKSYGGGPYQEIHVVIHTDELTLSHGELRTWLEGHRFARPCQIHKAYLLFSYDPTCGGYPLLELRFDDVGAA